MQSNSSYELKLGLHTDTPNRHILKSHSKFLWISVCIKKTCSNQLWTKFCWTSWDIVKYLHYSIEKKYYNKISVTVLKLELGKRFYIAMDFDPPYLYLIKQVNGPCTQKLTQYLFALLRILPDKFGSIWSSLIRYNAWCY